MIHWALLLSTLGSPASSQAAEVLRYQVTAAKVEVGELTLELDRSHIRARGASSGALLVFFPALEEVDVYLKGGLPIRIRRRYNHAGVTGRWRASFGKERITVEGSRGTQATQHVVWAPRGVLDPASALQKVRSALPARQITLRVFAGRSVFRLRLRRVGRSPLQYRGALKRITGPPGRPKERSVPFWVRALGLNRGATPKPEVRVWFGKGPRYVPRRIRLSNRMGMIELHLRADSLRSSHDPRKAALGPAP